MVGVAASLLDIPLHAPVDTYFNSATVTLGALIAGGIAGLLWRVLAARQRRLPIFVGALAGAFALVTAIAVAAAGTLDRSASYVVPLAGVVLGGITALTPVLSPRLGSRATVFAVASLVAALALGGALANLGDGESGRLELPARSLGETVLTKEPNR